MKPLLIARQLLIGAAALLAAGCDTGPYGQPQPPAYPGDAYPPTPYPQDAGAPPPYQPGPPAPAACPIASSRDWAAWINAMPGPNARPKLIVTGKVITATGGYQIAFEPYLQVARRYPARAFATMIVTPPSGPASQGVVTHDVRWEWPLNQQIGSVELRCGSDTLATISPVETAH